MEPVGTPAATRAARSARRRSAVGESARAAASRVPSGAATSSSSCAASWSSRSASSRSWSAVRASAGIAPAPSTSARTGSASCRRRLRRGSSSPGAAGPFVGSSHGCRASTSQACAVAARRTERNGLLRRPFLSVRRAATAHACEVLALHPWLDPTNGPAGPGEELPLRSRLRHEVLPVLAEVLGAGVIPALARTADQLREDADLLDQLAAQLLEDVAAPDGTLDAAALADSPTALRRRALRAALVAAGVPTGSISRAHVVAVDALVVHWNGQGPIALPGGAHVARRCGRLTVCPGRGGAAAVDASDMGGDLERVLLTEQQLDQRLGELAAQIDADYAGRDLLLVGVLKGAVMVMADLSRRLRTRGPASVEIAALLRKPEAAKVDVEVRYVGFDIPSEFVVGYGLDYAEKYRNLPFVGTLAQHVYGDWSGD